MRRLSPTDTAHCDCRFCRQRAARSSARRIAIVTALVAAGCLAYSWRAEEVGAAIVAGLAGFALLVIAFVAGLES